MNTSHRGKRAAKILEQELGPLTLGKLIKSIRLSENETQEIFGKRLDISKQQLSDIEKGKPVSVGLAAEYADTLGYSRDQFIKLCLQDTLARSGLAYTVEVARLKPTRKSQSGSLGQQPC